MKAKRFLSLLIAVVLSLSSIAVFAEDLVTEENLAESLPYVEAVDYSDMSNWAYWNSGEDKKADLFFVCPTVDMGKEGNFNAYIADEKYRSSFVGAINMELGIYNDVASVYAPYYKQATFPVYSLGEEEQEIYLSSAYEDVKNAFIYYADHTDQSRPLILAGFSQGADMIIRLMKDLFDEPKYQRRLVAAYAIGWKLIEDEVKEYPHLMPAEGDTDTGVIIAFNSEDKEISSSLIIGENEKTYSINPLNWKTTSEVAEKAQNLGACFTDYSGNIKEEIPNLTGAYIDEKRGALKVTDIAKEDYPAKLFDEGIYHLYDYQFFYRNLQENVSKRLSAYNEKYADRIDVYYNDDIVSFDVEPIIENGRTLVPFRTIFETMGCAVYYTEENGRQIVSANRENDSLTLTIGENKMYFNGKEIALDVPAKIIEDRTLVPLRAISEAFECKVDWNGNTKTVYIYSSENAENNTKVIKPLPETLDMANLDNCTLAVSLEKGDAYVDDSGKMVMDVTVYSYDLYDMVDIATLEVNDVIVRKNEEVTITDIERLESGLVRINGGEENGGFDLISNDSTVYYEFGMNDIKAYYEIGKATLPVSVDFRYIDESDLEREAKLYYPGDFLTDYVDLEYNFSPNNTSIVIENGTIMKMYKVYMP